MEGLLTGGAVDGPRRILLLTTNFGRNLRGMPLFDDLARCFARRGHSVHVSLLDWSAPVGSAAERYVRDDGVTVAAVPAIDRPGRLGRLARWLLSSARLARHDRAGLAASYDLAVAISPLTAMALPVLRATRAAAVSYAYITDFFPRHQAELGLFPRGPAVAAAQRAETALLRRFDVIGCMSRQGVRFLRAHYALDPGQPAEVLPLWSDAPPPAAVDRGAIRARWALPQDRPIAIFGGQLAPGRGLDDVIAAARAAPGDGDRTLFLVMGDGPLRGMIEAAADTTPDLLFRPSVPHEAYRALLQACDIGLVATVADVSVPTFPSKTLDYCRAGLPIVASVEAATDYGDFLAEQGCGVAVTAGSGAALRAAVAGLVADPARHAAAAEAARDAAARIFGVERAADQLLAHLARDERSGGRKE